MNDRLSKLLSFTLGLLLTVAVLFMFTAWDFRAVDVAAGIVFLLGIGVGVWATRVWYGIGR